VASWVAELQMDQVDLRVTWQQSGQNDKQCSLPYGLSRADVQAAIMAGP
jgi:hypothetical protein